MSILVSQSRIENAHSSQGEKTGQNQSIESSNTICDRNIFTNVTLPNSSSEDRFLHQFFNLQEHASDTRSKDELSSLLQNATYYETVLAVLSLIGPLQRSEDIKHCIKIVETFTSVGRFSKSVQTPSIDSEILSCWRGSDDGRRVIVYAQSVLGSIASVLKGIPESQSPLLRLALSLHLDRENPIYDRSLLCHIVSCAFPEQIKVVDRYEFLKGKRTGTTWKGYSYSSIHESELIPVQGHSIPSPPKDFSRKEQVALQDLLEDFKSITLKR